MKKLISQLAVATASLAVMSTLFAQERYYEWRWEFHPMWWGAWGLGMMWMMFIFWILVIVALVVVIRWLSSKGKASRTDSALEILRQRYARGEINRDEFEAKKKDLSC
jgi:putative membrane protein